MVDRNREHGGRDKRRNDRGPDPKAPRAGQPSKSREDAEPRATSVNREASPRIRREAFPARVTANGTRRGR
jgi:hypothetical protein